MKYISGKPRITGQWQENLKVIFVHLNQLKSNEIEPACRHVGVSPITNWKQEMEPLKIKEITYEI